MCDEISIDVKLVILDDDEFESFKVFLINVGVELKDPEEGFALGCNLGGIPHVILSDKVVDFDEDIKMIILLHECAHAIEGIMDEEEADRWALEALTPDQGKILISLWNERHGHEYEVD